MFGSVDMTTANATNQAVIVHETLVFTPHRLVNNFSCGEV